MRPEVRQIGFFLKKKSINNFQTFSELKELAHGLNMDAMRLIKKALDSEDKSMEDKIPYSEIANVLVEQLRQGRHKLAILKWLFLLFRMKQAKVCARILTPTQIPAQTAPLTYSR